MTAEQILNAVWANASLDYRERVPQATQDNIAEVGNAILKYAPNQNEFLEALVNKIGMQIFARSRFENKFKEFKNANMEYGDTIEEIQINLIKSEQFNDNADQFAKNKPDVATQYHTINDDRVYPVTIDDKWLKRAFTSNKNLTSLVSQILDKVEESADVDDFNIVKDMLSQDIYGKVVDLPETENDEARARQVVKSIKKFVEDMQFVRTDYNKLARETSTRKEDLILVMRADVKVDIDVDLLAKTLNIGKAELDTRIITIDEFTDQPQRVAVLIDKNAIIWVETDSTNETARNAKARYTNYFKHLSNVFSVSLFHNIIAFDETEEPSVVEKIITTTGEKVYTFGDTSNIASIDYIQTKLQTYDEDDVLQNVQMDENDVVVNNLQYEIIDGTDVKVNYDITIDFSNYKNLVNATATFFLYNDEEEMLYAEGISLILSK